MREFLPAPRVTENSIKSDCKKLDIKQLIEKGTMIQHNKIAR